MCRPTRERVGRMLTGTHRDPREIIGQVLPKWAPATIEKIAVNCVMAGCLPEYLPVVIAAVEGGRGVGSLRVMKHSDGSYLQSLIG